MKNLIDEIVARCSALIDGCSSSQELDDVRVRFLGKNGEFTGILRGMKDVPPAEKPIIGKLINEARVSLENSLKAKESELAKAELERRLESEKIDITLSNDTEIGSVHPLTLVKNEIVDIFIGLGFSVQDGPEIETDFFNFQALGIPLDHPARDMQDSLYVSEKLLLRTQTSTMQARTMLSTKPPIRIVCPGKVYRADDDASHSPLFNQVEGLVVDKNVSLSQLKGTLEMFAQKFFGKETKVRFRPSYFPFTEPSVEVDCTCSVCGGKGCRLCKGTGWIEVLGAGVVNPVVFENCGIDPKVYSGYAFGFGVDRMAMIKYGIPDIRLLYENDVRFLKQYK